MGKKIILIGLGNPILGDDGVGWQVIEHIQQNCILPTNVDTDCLALGGISLMEQLIGYDQAVLVDAIVTGQGPIGSVMLFELDDFPNPSAGHLASSHDTTLPIALEMGRSMGAKLPERITVVGVEAEHIFDFSEELSTPIRAAIPEAARLVMKILDESS